MTILILAGLAFSVAAVMLGVGGHGRDRARDRRVARHLAARAARRAGVGPRLARSRDRRRGGGGRVRADRRREGETERRSIRSRPRWRSPRMPTGEPALLGSLGRTNAWTRLASRRDGSGPGVERRCARRGRTTSRKSAPRVGLEAPTATLVRDTLIDGARRVIFRVNVPRRARRRLTLRALGAPVIRTAIDGARRGHDSISQAPAYVGDAVLGRARTAVPCSRSPFRSARISIVAMASRSAGTSGDPGRQIPPRPRDVVPAQIGDVRVIYAKFSSEGAVSCSA